MSFLKRAFLYITRKRVKSLILFLIILVIATLELAGIAIKNASSTAQLNVRQALGGIFTMEQNTSDSSKWESRQVGGFGYQSWYNGEALSEELADTIMKKVDGIKGYNATATHYVIVAKKNGTTCQLLESEGDSEMYVGLGSYGDFNSTVSTYASTNTEFDSYFTGGYIELVEGRHITSKDTNAIMMSQEMAELNGLTVGDKLQLHMPEYKASMINYDVEETKMEVELVGLFHSTTKSSTMFSNWSMDNSIFTTLNVVCFVRPDSADEAYEKIEFSVDDPGELTNIVEQINSLPEFDPTDFVLKVDNSNVESITKPLDNMNRLLTVLIILILIIGAVILYLVLSGRVKERIHESGVLLSFGLSKRNVIAQYITEVVIIAVLSFTVSAFSGNLIAQTVGNALISYSLEESDDGSENKSLESRDGITTSSSKDFAPTFEKHNSMTKISVTIEPSAITFIFLIGLLLVCVSVIFATLPLLQMKPREILSKMS